MTIVKAKSKNFPWLPMTAILVLATICLPAQAKPEMRPAIYDPDADVKADIVAAVKRAGAENRNILLVFGGNWCPWCHLLHGLFSSDPQVSKVLAERYVVVMVDVGEKPNQPLNRDLVDLYRVKDFGYPALAVLDKGGKLVCAQSTGVLEKGKGHDPAKVLAFLRTQLGD